MLKIYNPDAPTEVHADASKFGYGAILLQKDSGDGLIHPVEYCSKKTLPPEKNYYKLEVLAIVNALKKWRTYLIGIIFTIYKDCSAFTKTMQKDDVPVRVARWTMFLQDFNYTHKHRSHVDALSRSSHRKHNDMQTPECTSR